MLLPNNFPPASSVKLWDLRTGLVERSMSSSDHGPKLCGDALAIRGDLCVTGSLIPDNAIELWCLKVCRMGVGRFLW